MRDAFEAQAMRGELPVLVTSPSIRPTKSIMTRSPSFALAVLARGLKSRFCLASSARLSLIWPSSTFATFLVSSSAENSETSNSGTTCSPPSGLRKSGGEGTKRMGAK